MRLKYNFLAAAQVFFSLVFFFLIASVFGATSNSDAFLITYSMFASIQLLQLMAVEQFLYFYQQEKQKSLNSGISFYQSSAVFAFLVGLLFFLVFHYFNTKFIGLFSVFSNKEGSTDIIENIFPFMSWGLLVYPVTYVNDRLLNAENKFSLPYISETMPFVFMSLYLFQNVLIDVDVSIYGLAIYKNIGMLAGLLTTSLVIWRLGFFKKYAINFTDEFVCFIKNSFQMRFAHNLNNFGVNFIVNAFLITLAPGLASIYHYAFRGVTVVKQVVIGPFYRVFQTQISLAFSKNNFIDIKTLSGQFFQKSTIVFILFIFVGWLLLEPALDLLAPDKLSKEWHMKIPFYFVLIALWHFFMVAELSSITVYMAAKDSMIFFYVNLVIISLLFIVVSQSSDLSLVGFILINAVLQAFSFVFYYMMFKKKLLDYESRNSS